MFNFFKKRFVTVVTNNNVEVTLNIAEILEVRPTMTNDGFFVTTTETCIALLKQGDGTTSEGIVNRSYTCPAGYARLVKQIR